MKNVLIAAVPLVASVITRDISVAYVGVGLNVIVACSAGSYASFSFSKGTETRKEMFGLFIACVIMGCAMTAITFGLIEHFQKVVISEGFKAGVGALVSFIGRFFLPWAAETIRSGTWVNWLPFIQKKKE